MKQRKGAMSRIGLGVFLFGIMFFGLLWWVMKPVIDMFTVDMLGGLAVELGITNQELAYFSILPFIIGGMLGTWLVLRLVWNRGNKE